MTSVYENITYEQLKELPEDQKPIALQELKTKFPDNKDLAKYLDAAHIAISNMVGKYLEGKPLGRKKMTDEEKAQAKAERELKKQQEGQKQAEQIQQKYEVISQEAKQEFKEETDVKVTFEDSKPIQNIQSKTNSFSVTLNKDLVGGEAVARLNGIANSLLTDNQYKVSLVIEEVGEV